MFRHCLLILVSSLAACGATENQRTQEPDPIEDPPLTATTDPNEGEASIPQTPAAQKRYVGASVDAFGAT